MPTWLESLKAWNAKKGGKYVIPRKGTSDYDAIRKMMGGEALKGVAVGAKPEPAPQNKKVLAKWMKPKSEEAPKEPPVAKMSKAVATGIRKSAVERAVKKYKAQEAESERIHQERVRISQEDYERRRIEALTRVRENWGKNWPHPDKEPLRDLIFHIITDQHRLDFDLLGVIMRNDEEDAPKGTTYATYINDLKKAFTQNQRILIKKYIVREDLEELYNIKNERLQRFTFSVGFKFSRPLMKGNL